MTLSARATLPEPADALLAEAPPLNGFMVAAPSSGSGKSVITMGLLRALRRRGVAVRSAKSGPDFIDPAFHKAASGRDCVNLDAWGMRPELIRHHAQGDDLLVVEAAMGLFDGAADGSGSAADLAGMLGLPVVLVVDCAKQSQSVAALVQGFVRFREDVQIAGVIANRIGSPRHLAMIARALDGIGVALLGHVPRDECLALPSRHLGLVGASETSDLETFLEDAGKIVARSVDLDRLIGLKRGALVSQSPAPTLPPPRQTIAIASDGAFPFLYPHIVEGWRRAGAAVCLFSPLNNEAVPRDADCVFLPGGYPELHAGKLASNEVFLQSLRKAAQAELPIHGECGGYMILGEGLVDADGQRHAMAGLLPLVTSFAKRKRHLGYRRAKLMKNCAFLGEQGQMFATHEFHYSQIESGMDGQDVFAMEDATGEKLGICGHQRGSVSGSYLHIIDRREP